MRVLITDYGFQHIETERKIIESAGHELLTAQCRTEDELIEAARACQALLVQWAPVGKRVVETLKDCRLVVRYGIGVDNLDLPALKSAGISVCNVPDYCIDEVADHSMALALALLRQIPQTHARVMQGDWKITPPARIPSFKNATFATAGYGRIARSVLNRARAFGFQPAAYDPYVSEESMASEGVQVLSLDALFSESDVISLHLPLGPETQHFVSAARLRQMKSTTVLINTARGGLVDTRALAGALNSGQLGGAGLDVFEAEPLEQGHPLRSAANALLTSHTAWNSDASVAELQRKAAEEVVRGLAGESLKNPL
ncbi:MAG: C-terminal binding protein [Opitutales bacterium]|nr:C-terminal binding protein [Opitutales bacterium]